MYNHKIVEKKWQEYWDKNNTFKTDVWDFSKPKYYVLDMFPYPSGEGLHIGHPEGYTATDVVARMKRMQGFNVLHPMGFDSFGLPAEQYAIKTGNHPGEFTQKNIENYIRQLKMLGFSFDWTKQVATSDSSFYKWTQWIFKQLYLDGLAKYVDMPVNWCEELGTVLANDEVIDGKSERGGYPVIRKNMKQWVIDIPKYAERLLEGLDTVDWPLSTKEMQRNWIGKSEGALVTFKVDNKDFDFTVFTTRADTLFGATYCVLAPEHELVLSITTEDKKEEVLKYINECSTKSDLERTELNKNKTGIFTGAYAINPVNNKKIPIWISDYVLVTYGTGAIMAVPAHDDRDYEFATKFNLEIIPVLAGGNIKEKAHTEDGIHINSGFLDCLNKEDAINVMNNYLEEHKLGEKRINYRLREWIFARQRYWGEPVPIIHMEDGSIMPVSDNELPVVLPELDNYSPDASGKSPLTRATNWMNVNIDGKKGIRETSTMPGSAGSSWYFLRYIDPNNNDEFANKKLLEHWLPIDLYLGGSEHAVGHLLYSRLWNNYLYDKGLVPVKEPFKKLFHQGMILGSNNEKMSKSTGNVVNPDEVVANYGSDTLRVFEMFMGPLEASKPWNENSIEGSKKFLERIYRLYNNGVIKEQVNPNLEKVYNQTVKKVTEDYESLNINTAISQMMIFINAVNKEEVFPKEYALNFLKLLNPLAPHITEELWQLMGNNNTISYETWPTFDELKLVNETFELVVQVNGKVRGKIEVSSSTREDEMKLLALEIDNVKKYIEGKEIIKVVVIPQKLVSIVIK